MKIALVFCLSLLSCLSLAQTSPRTEVSLSIARDVAPGPKIQVAITTQNLRSIKVGIYKLPASELIKTYSDVRKAGGSLVRTLDVNMAERTPLPKKGEDAYYQREVNLPNLPPGLYALRSDKAAAYANITNLAVIHKTVGGESLAWVTNFKTGKPVPGATVRVVDQSGAPLGAGKTNGNGAALFSHKTNEKGAFLTVSSGPDLAALPISVRAITTQRFNVQTDRTLYRPGDEVQYKFTQRKFLGSNGYSVPKGDKVRVEVRSPFGLLLDRKEGVLSQQGTFSGAFVIPGEGALGSYSVSLFSGTTPLGMKEVSVEEYRKPEFKVSASSDRPRWLAGETLTAKVDVETYFGSKVPGATIQWTVRQTATQRPEAFDFNYDYREVYAESPVLGTGVTRTDENGAAVIQALIPKGVKDGVAEIEVKAIDATNREVSASASTPVFAAETRVFLKPLVGFVPLGKLYPIEVKLTNLAGAPVGGRVTLTTRSNEWDAKKNERFLKVHSKQDAQVPATGVVTVNVPTKTAYGLQLVAEVKDKAGRVNTDATYLYVASPFSPTEQKDPSLEIAPSAKEMKPGEEIKAYIKASEKNPVLVVMEGVNIWDYKILTASGTVAFKTTVGNHPVVTLTASQWTKNGLLSGNAEVQVTDPAKKIKVKLTPNRVEFGPGEKSDWKVSTLDASGKPVQADLVFSVVDEALLALSGPDDSDPYRAFWGFWPNMTETRTSMPTVYAGGAFQARPAAAKAALPLRGGISRFDYDPSDNSIVVAKDAPIRTNFLDTAFWKPDVLTDEAGQALVSFNLPDNLTTWKAKASGQTQLTAAGEGSQSVKATLPITLRLAVPRQMAIGDEVRGVYTVNNRSTSVQKVKIKVNALGNETEFEATVEPKGQATGSFPLEASASGSAEILGELFDSTGRRVDAVLSKVPIRAGGVKFRQSVSGRVGVDPIKLSLPEDRDPRDAVGRIILYPGRSAMVGSLVNQVLESSRWSPLAAAAQLPLMAAKKKSWQNPDVQSAYGMLTRSASSGWGVYEGAPSDPVTTARVLIAAQEASSIPEVGIPFRDLALAQAQSHLATGLPDGQCLMALAMAKASPSTAKEVLDRAWDNRGLASPTARLALAEALLLMNRSQDAKSVVQPLLESVSRGSGSSMLPVGEGVGWTGSELEANLRLLRVLLTLGEEKPLQDQLAAWVASEGNGWSSITEKSLLAQVLGSYESANPSPVSLRNPTVTLGGQALQLQKSPDGEWAVANFILPVEKELKLEVSGADKALWTLEAETVRRVEGEGGEGVKTLFRWEVATASGAWEELNRDVRPGEPVRCTAIVWGDALADLVKVSLPIPAGFEMVQFEGNGRQEVRDGAIIYYTTVADGRPETFRFFLRAESEGSVFIPPAQAEVVRRPQRRGWSGPGRAVVAAPAKKP